jgi:hypothetical protein
MVSGIGWHPSHGAPSDRREAQAAELGHLATSEAIKAIDMQHVQFWT